MLILGLNAFHADASACLVKDGALIAAAEEERFRRIKHWAGFPSEAIKWCLQEAGARLSDVDHVALNQDSRANLWKRTEFLVKARPDFGLVLDRIRTRKERVGADQLLEQMFPGQKFKGKVHGIEHHMAHLSSAFHVSPFEEAIAISVDGFGDFASAAWGIGRGTNIDIEGRVYFPHSLGILYQSITQYLGFPNYGDEYKVMGLAPYGEPKYLSKLRNLVSLEANGGYKLDTKYFRHHKEYVPYQWENGSPVFADLFTPELEELLGPRRQKEAPLEQYHRDLARSAQALYEEAFFNLINAARKDRDLKDIVLAGGCANNSVANGKIRRETAYERVYVHAAPGDQGGAIGAAFSMSRAAKSVSPWSTPIGGRAIMTMNARQPLMRVKQKLPGLAAQLSSSQIRQSSASGRRRRFPKEKSLAGSRDVWSGARERWATAQSCVTHAGRT
jgi:carbamoyltransferase